MKCDAQITLERIIYILILCKSVKYFNMCCSSNSRRFNQHMQLRSVIQHEQDMCMCHNSGRGQDTNSKSSPSLPDIIGEVRSRMDGYHQLCV